MRLGLPLLAAAVALAAAGPASADTTTILLPPAKAPVTIPGSDVSQGDALTDDQQLLRRTVDVRSPRTRLVTLRCPEGTVHAGLGVFEDARVGFAYLGKRTYIGRRTLRLRAFAAPKTPRGRLLHASVFALCQPPPSP